MAETPNHFQTLVSTGILQKLLSSKIFNIAQVSAILSLLIKYRIPFDLGYTPGNRREYPVLVLTVFLNPDVSIDFSLGFGALQPYLNT